MKISADTLAHAVEDFFQELFRAVPGAEVFRRDGVLAMYSGIP
jgi:hypothetical protein